MPLSELLGFLAGVTVFGLFFRLAIWPSIANARNRRIAEGDLPGFAGELGLHHTPSKSPQKLGTLSGEQGGFRIEVTPDEYHKVHLRLGGDLEPFVLGAFYSLPQKLVMRAIVLLGQDDPHDRDFDFGVSLLDRYFDQRMAESEVVRHLVSPPVSEAIVAFVTKWKPKLDGLSISQSEIACCLTVGRDKPPSITADQIRALVPDMVFLASALEDKAAVAEADARHAYR